MSRLRSPNYPNISLPEAIARARKVYAADRKFPLDRDVVAKHMGYSGRNGASDKTLGSVAQYGLFESVSKGEVRVTDLAEKIFHPASDQEKAKAILEAAYTPAAFSLLMERFGQGTPPSDEAATSYLVRNGFLDRAIPPLISSYKETCLFLEQEGVSDFTVPSDNIEGQSTPSEQEEVLEATTVIAARTPIQDLPRSNALQQNVETNRMGRLLTQGMLSKNSTFEIVVTGNIGPKEIDTLIRKLEIDKELLADEDVLDEQESVASARES